jgi:hypothetical protein
MEAPPGVYAPLWTNISLYVLLRWTGGEHLLISPKLSLREVVLQGVIERVHDIGGPASWLAGGLLTGVLIHVLLLRLGQSWIVKGRLRIARASGRGVVVRSCRGGW